MTYLTVPIPATDFEQAKKHIKQAFSAGAEALELRTDYLEALSIELVRALIAQTRTICTKAVPIIVTCRDKREGGAGEHPVGLRVSVLTEAAKAGVEFIDFEYQNFLKTENQEKIRLALSQSSKTRLILSAHDFEAKFANIKKLYRDILAVCPVAIPKLVYTVYHINDCYEAFDLLRQTGDERIVFCMGQAGLISRILAKKLGSLVTFASVDDESATAPGQLTIDQFRNLYRYDSIDTETGLYGVIADPVGHSLSPAIHNACFAQAKMNKLYLPLLVQGDKNGFDAFMRSVLQRKWLDFGGFSVTIPHKQNALEFVRASAGFVEPLAEKFGAINTVLISKDNTLKAYNTDYAGALDAITDGSRIKRRDLKRTAVAVIGAGGVARAIVAGLTDAGAKIKIYNRTVEKAEKLASEFGCEFAGLDELKGMNAKLVVNCTSIGMHPDVDATPIPVEFLKKGMVIFDTVYNPAKTLLLKQAKRKRLKTIDGVSMFVNQAMSQFRLFTGQDGNAKLMRKVVCDSLLSS
jgi:3-dehydroquinate dehydratase/shikimate dehydrogenase